MFKGFYFFSSYRNALKEFHASEDYESQAILVHAMCDYIFDGKEPDLKRADLRAVWQLLRLHLNESIEIERDKEKKREAGKKGAAVTNRKKREKSAERQNSALPKSAERQNSALPKSAERQNSALPKSAERKNKNKNENEKENENTDITVPSPVVTEKDIIQFYLDTGLQSKFLKADMTLSDFAVKNITAYTEKNACGINTENFEDYKKYAIACYNKAKEGAGLKGS